MTSSEAGTELPVRLKPRERDYLHWDDKLTLEFNGRAPSVRALEITRAKNIPTVFLAGNSTVVGAYQLAKCVVKGIQENVPGLAKYLKHDLPAYDPARPDDPATWQLPPSPFIGWVKPDGN